MCEALRELFADDLRESELRGRNAGKIESVIQQTVKKYKKGCTVEETADMLEESVGMIEQIYNLLNEYAPDYNVEKYMRHCRRNHNGKRPVVIEGTFKVVVRRFHTEMQKEKKTFSTVEKCQGRIHRIKRWCVCMKDIFLYPNIVATVTVFFEELEEKKTSITYMLSSYEFGLPGDRFRCQRFYDPESREED